jgi:hypothetical protein
MRGFSSLLGLADWDVRSLKEADTVPWVPFSGVCETVRAQLTHWDEFLSESAASPSSKLESTRPARVVRPILRFYRDQGMVTGLHGR